MWWHLALGRAYAAQGPWLDADPLLYTATAAPAPATPPLAGSLKTDVLVVGAGALGNEVLKNWSLETYRLVKIKLI